MGTSTQNPPTQLCMWQSRVFTTLFIGSAVSNSACSTSWWPFWSCFVFQWSYNWLFSFTWPSNFGPMNPDIGDDFVPLGRPWLYAWHWALLCYFGLPPRIASICTAMGHPEPTFVWPTGVADRHLIWHRLHHHQLQMALLHKVRKNMPLDM